MSNPSFFTPLEGLVLVHQAGVYRELPLCHLQGILHAKDGKSYYELREHNNTSRQKLFWKTIQTSWSYEARQNKMMLIATPSSIIRAV